MTTLQPTTNPITIPSNSNLHSNVLLSDQSQPITNKDTNEKRGLDFWMVFSACLIVNLLSALDLTAVSTALPTIVGQLKATDFIWAGSAYAIASTAVLPTVGGLVSIFGRKPILLGFILCFAVGSAISGSAQNMNMLLAGRVLQGFGGGGCLSCTDILYTDLVPLPERGKYLGITTAAIGPPIGGTVSNVGSTWRWLFFLNIPFCVISTILVVIFLRVHTPKESFRKKFARIDWLGNIIIILSTTSVLIALSWAGIRFPWDSVNVLAPLCLGFIGIIAFFLVEAYWVKEPTIPWSSIKNRTTMSGYLETFFHGIASLCVIYYLPVYFQATKNASPIRSGVYFLGLAVIIPVFAILAGASVAKLQRYRPQNYIGWILMTIGFVLLSTLDANSSKLKFIGFQVILGMGLGMIWICTQFPILAPLPFSDNAHAMAFFTFIRCFAQAWGTVIGGTILQNTLSNRLPPSFISSLPQGVQIAYAIIPSISSMPEPLRDQVRTAFAESVAQIWRVMIGVSAVGLLTCLLMREVEMRVSVDETWSLKKRSDEYIELIDGDDSTNRTNA